MRPVPGGVADGRGHDDYDTAVPDAALIDSDVLERVLSTALAGGGDMAEVFAEDAATASAMLDDRRVEELSSGRNRGAGHPGGRRRDDRVRPHGGPERARPAGGGPRRGGCRPPRRRRRPDGGARPALGARQR